MSARLARLVCCRLLRRHRPLTVVLEASMEEDRLLAVRRRTESRKA